MEYSKYYFSFSWCGFISYLHPLAGDIYSLLAIFTINFICGLLAGLFVQNDKASLKKFRKGWLTDIVLFFSLMAAIYFCGQQKGQQDQALNGISFITYSCFYFYGINILKNLNRLFPQNRVIAFLYYVLSFEFTKKIPGLERFLKKEEEAKKDHINNK